MKVSALIINWNGVEKLKKFLPQILKVEAIDEFIVADDASTDTSVEVLKREFPQVKLVIREKNGGFSSNVNSGLKEVSGELVILLNPDAVPDRDCLKKARPFFEDPELFAIGCNTGGNWSWAQWSKGFIWHYMHQGQPETHETLWARGGSGIFRKSLLDKLGGMDETLNPFYEEDFDLGYRATKRGYKILWAKECVVRLPDEKGVIETNFGQKAFSRVAQRNQLLVLWKNITDNSLLISHLWYLTAQCLIHPRYMMVVWSALARLPQILEKKTQEKAYLKLNDRQVLEKYS